MHPEWNLEKKIGSNIILDQNFFQLPIGADMSVKICEGSSFPNMVVLYIDGKEILCLLKIIIKAVLQKDVERSYD